MGTGACCEIAAPAVCCLVWLTPQAVPRSRAGDHAATVSRANPCDRRHSASTAAAHRNGSCQPSPCDNGPAASRPKHPFQDSDLVSPERVALPWRPSRVDGVLLWTVSLSARRRTPKPITPGGFAGELRFLQVNISADLVDAVLERHARGTPFGVAAVMVGSNAEAGRDGQRWRLDLSDGTAVRRSRRCAQAPWVPSP